ncbi:MAG: GntR family transcriptional regulator [Bryobacteraceae bacterium]
MSSTLPPLRTTAIRESVVDLLRGALLEGRFAPGESLSEPALASQLGISRGPVREALLVLQQEGLVTHAQNRGFAVMALGPGDRQAMVKVRIPLEALALELAKPVVQAADLLELEAAIDRMVSTYLTDSAITARDDLAFHERLWELTGNSWLLIALRRITKPFFMHTMMYRARTEQLDVATYERQHRDYMAFLRGETDMSAEECVRSHLRLYEDVAKSA